MRESFQNLLHVACTVMVFCGRASFEVHTCEDRAFVDIQAGVQFDPAQLLRVVEGHRVTLYPAGDFILVRVYEN